MKRGVPSSVLKGLGELAKETVVKAGKEPVNVLETALGGKGSSAPTRKKVKGKTSYKEGKGEEKDQLAALREELRGEMEKKRQGRNLEEEVKVVRRKKEEEEEREKAFLEELERRRKEEKEAAKKEAETFFPKGKKPRGLAPWVQKGTREKGLRRGG